MTLAVLYLVLLAIQFGGVVAGIYTDADTASAPVIGQLLASAPAHASVVLGQFGWYFSLLFDLATKWLPGHRQLWEAWPYALVLVSVGLTAWSVWRIAGRMAAGLTAALMICAAPHTLHLLFSQTEHAPTWFVLAMLGAFLVFLQRRGTALRLSFAVPSALIVGAITGVNAASDSLVVIACLVPFILGTLSCYALARGPDSSRAAQVALATLIVTAVSWAITNAWMSAIHVVPTSAASTSLLASGNQIASNFTLWWQSIAVLGNGDFFGRQLSITTALAVASAAVSIAAVVLLPRLGWRELRTASGSRPDSSRQRLAFVVFWCSSALTLSVAFVLSASPQDINADRYLVGLIYAAAAVIPVVATGRLLTTACRQQEHSCLRCPA